MGTAMGTGMGATASSALHAALSAAAPATTAAATHADGAVLRPPTTAPTPDDAAAAHVVGCNPSAAVPFLPP